MYVVTVEFTLKPGTRERFMPLMLENARASREEEPGCRQFDVSVDPAKPDVVFLYELYDDRAAFDAHLAAAHFKSFDAAVREMIASRVLKTLERVAPK